MSVGVMRWMSKRRNDLGGTRNLHAGPLASAALCDGPAFRSHRADASIALEVEQFLGAHFRHGVEHALFLVEHEVDGRVGGSVAIDRRHREALAPRQELDDAFPDLGVAELLVVVPVLPARRRDEVGSERDVVALGADPAWREARVVLAANLVRLDRRAEHDTAIMADAARFLRAK
jgi:hypothetical protein